ncbi:MAG: peptidyl-prolyl cis-trans isomerase [Chloroflexota bacterium]
MTMSAAPAPATHVATVAGRAISVACLEEREAALRRLPRGRHLPPAGGVDPLGVRRWIVQELVTEALILHEARREGIAASTVDAAVGPLVERVARQVTVPARDVRGYYERNQDRYRHPESRRVRHVLVATDAAARAVADAIRHGDEMAGVARRVSIDAGTRASGGDLGDVRRGELAGPFEDAIFGAACGSLVGPIRTEHGWHVARVESVTAASQIPFDEARPAIEARLLADARLLEFERWLERRRAAVVVIEPEFEHPAHPIHGAGTHRH